MSFALLGLMLCRFCCHIIGLKIVTFITIIAVCAETFIENYLNM